MAAAVAAAIGTDFGANALAPVSNTVTMNRRIDAPSQAVARINRRRRRSYWSSCGSRRCLRISAASPLRYSESRARNAWNIGVYLLVRLLRNIDVAMMSATGADAAPTNLLISI